MRSGPSKSRWLRGHDTYHFVRLCRRSSNMGPRQVPWHATDVICAWIMLISDPSSALIPLIEENSEFRDQTPCGNDGEFTPDTGRPPMPQLTVSFDPFRTSSAPDQDPASAPPPSPTIVKGAQKMGWAYEKMVRPFAPLSPPLSIRFSIDWRKACARLSDASFA